MEFKKFIKNLVTLGGEDRKFIKEVDDYIVESEKKMKELDDDYEELKWLMESKRKAESHN